MASAAATPLPRSPTSLHSKRGFVVPALFLLSLVSGCVVSTHEGLGVAPAIPIPPERVNQQATESIDAEQTGPQEIAASHILIAYREAMRAAPYVERSKDEARTFAQGLRDRALSGEDFAQLAKEFSDDRGSAANGGSLGRFRRDQMVPEFSKAAFALEVGDVSAVVESPFGFHVILRDP
jgi:parvulin-like peptidyl-prolyl isomerase